MNGEQASKSLNLAETDEAILDCIDSVLDMLGKNVKHSVYSSWLSSDNSNRGILTNPEAFIDVLRESFGIGAYSMEMLFLREIRKCFIDQLGMALPDAAKRDFPSLVLELRKIAKKIEAS